MPLSPEYLASLHALVAAATPGPWEHVVDPECPDDVRVCYVRDGSHCEWCIALAGNTVDGEQWTPGTLARWKDDAAFIAASREALPRLLDELKKRERLRATLETLRHILSTEDPRLAPWSHLAHDIDRVLADVEK